MKHVLTFVAMIWAGFAQAHPHVFVDTALHLVTDDQGRLIGVEVTWQYDELYSLLVLEDMELDDDYDGVLTPAELSRLDGFDMQWIEGFAGDLYAQVAGQAVALGAPEPRGTAFKDGKITTRHFRAFAPQSGAMELRAFDPTYYTAYDLTGGVHVPQGCKVIVTPPDLEAAYAAVEEALKNAPPDPDDYPEVGDKFAEKVVVSCGA